MNNAEKRKLKTGHVRLLAVLQSLQAHAGILPIQRSFNIVGFGCTVRWC